MTMSENGFVYTGTWEHEGHSVSFKPKDESITISESQQSGKLSRNFSRTVPLKEGIAEQDQLIKWGYRKIS